ncbi:PEP-CTERM sorting domain-containing protein [Roseiconus lacunae]|uniref:PEP-CTERM sorting domain-containing protein n=1 Tax=Roseiconus lacunae TaxID=2605694 RepID=UPI001E45267D|nr:PEP-CTERM sorting domain-containing protein [Roseiconus lacunae]MCD0458901.1 PEP-CTERM sorting domain-containing protein [Roseiconus lacunae]
MLKKVLCFAVLATFASTASAGVMGHSILSLSNIRVINTSDNSVLTASFLGDASADIQATTSTTSATNRASLSTAVPSSVTTTGTAFVAGGGIIIPPVQAADAVAGSLAGDYLRSQSMYGGSFVDITDPGPYALIPTPAAATTQADFNVDNLGALGGASSNVTNTSSFNFIATSDITARLEFDAMVDMLLTDAFAPVNFYSSARTSFSVTLSESGATVPGFGGAEAESDLNQFISIPPSGSPATVLISDSYQSIDFDLTAGSFYTLTINQTASVTVGVVPEPSSFAAFGVLGLVTTVVRRRKR